MQKWIKRDKNVLTIDLKWIKMNPDMSDVIKNVWNRLKVDSIYVKVDQIWCLIAIDPV